MPILDIKKYFKKQKGFTLIELLIVIAIMAILTTVVFVALNPLGRFQDARNSRRWTDVNSILSAVKLHQVDHGGVYLSGIASLTPGDYYGIGSGASCNAEACVNGKNEDATNNTITLQAPCVSVLDLAEGSPSYLPSIPTNPSATGVSQDDTRYYLSLRTNGSVKVGACFTEKGSGDLEPIIEVER